MDTIAPSLAQNLGLIARVVKLFESNDIGITEFQKFADDPDYRMKVVLAMRLTEFPSVDLSKPFDQKAVDKLLRYLFSGAYSRSDIMQGDYWFSRVHGIDPHTLDQSHLRQIMDGMSDPLLTITVLRAGLLDGTPLPPGVVAERMGLNVKIVNRMRGEANAYMRSRQKELFEFLRPEVDHMLTSLLMKDRSSESIGSLFGNNPPPRVKRILQDLRAHGIHTVEDLQARPKADVAWIWLGDVAVRLSPKFYE